MDYDIRITTTEASPIAVVAASTTWAEFPSLWKPLLDQVWAFLRASDVRKDGHNVMLYRDLPDGDAGAEVSVEVGVQVEGSFEPRGSVVASTLPAGRTATTVHRGSPESIGDAHAAVLAWCAANGHVLDRTRWEIYGDWTEDPAEFETEVHWLLR